MKLFKSLFLPVGLLVCSQAAVNAMELGYETLPYVAQDIYEQIPEYIIPGIAITTLAGTCYVLHQISSGIDRALDNFTKNFKKDSEALCKKGCLTILECAAQRAVHKKMIQIQHSKK